MTSMRTRAEIIAIQAKLAELEQRLDDIETQPETPKRGRPRKNERPNDG